MYLLDTNAVSELRSKSRCAVAWGAEEDGALAEG